MPHMARANGMWRGPDPDELQRLSYCERKVINLARVYVSVKRIFLDRASYARTNALEAPLYHQRNVVAYPQNPDAALRALGMSPSNLARMLQVQFVGEDRTCIRSHPDLQVSVQNLRAAFRWLSLNSWPFMEATKHHDLWEGDKLDNGLEELLQQYVKSIGVVTGGVPAEILQGAARISAADARVSSSGPADCVAPECDQDEENPREAEDANSGDQCAGIIDGGVDDVTPVQICDRIMKMYKVDQVCSEELARLRKTDKTSEKDDLRQRQAVAVAAAVQALSELHGREVQQKLRDFVRAQNSDEPLVVAHSKTLLNNRDPFFGIVALCICSHEVIARRDVWSAPLPCHPGDGRKHFSPEPILLCGAKMWSSWLLFTTYISGGIRSGQWRLV